MLIRVLLSPKLGMRVHIEPHGPHQNMQGAVIYATEPLFGDRECYISGRALLGGSMYSTWMRIRAVETPEDQDPDGEERVEGTEVPSANSAKPNALERPGGLLVSCVSLKICFCLLLGYLIRGHRLFVS
jgi:hypothetical protein